MTSEQHTQYISLLADNFVETKDNISTRINELCSLVSDCNPLGLLKFSASMSFLAIANQLSEINYTAEQNYTVRATEYIQSILVSTENKYNFDIDGEKKDPSNKYNEILGLIMNIYKDIQLFYKLWGGLL